MLQFMGLALFIAGLLQSYPFPNGHEFSLTSLVFMGVGLFIAVGIPLLMLPLVLIFGKKEKS
jgi:hypothetical protein